jgi:hypothetical protein
MAEDNFYRTPGHALVYRDKDPISLDDPNLELEDLKPNPHDPRFNLTSPYHTVRFLGRTEPSEAPVDFVYVAGDLESLQVPDSHGMWADHEKAGRIGIPWRQAVDEVRGTGLGERSIGYHIQLAQKLQPEAGRLSLILAYGNPGVNRADLYYYLTK